MTDLINQLNKVRQKIKSGAANKLLMQKPFADGMYNFSMFMIEYYSRVRKNLNLDYDSFMIIQTVVSHKLYQLNKKPNSAASYSELETEWENNVKFSNSEVINELYDFKMKAYYKLTISSICLMINLPKETTRRKVNELCKANILKISKKEGIQLGLNYKKIFQEFVPNTTLQVSKLLKKWEKSGVLKSLLSFKV